ncbi:macro domain-containing protein [Aquimarina litoralis]|uniref:Macro domain-containing protein n=1 Tax=Aquimarina litoralis TaxID=584605 RepID=A0ABP3UAE5_9FLAO
MKTITYIKGDVTVPQAKGTKLIVHICNNIGGWGKGFVVAISKRWPEPEKAFREWYKNRAKNDFQLGAIQVVQVSDDKYIGNMIAQEGIKTARSKGVPIRYEAVQQCLEKIVVEAKELNASIHMPRIGCGLAGGKWERIEAIIEETLLKNDLDVYVYDFG